MNRFFVKLSRHDDHNIEIKSIVEVGEPRFSGTTDVFVFVPRSVHLKSWKKDEVLGDFRSRARLAVPVAIDSGRAALARAVAQVRMASVPSAPDDGAGSLGGQPQAGGQPSDVQQAAGRLAAVMSETLHGYSRRHREELRLLRAPGAGEASGRAYEAIAEAALRVGDLLAEVRGVIREVGLAELAVFRLLDEYVSHLFIQYLGKLRVELDRGRGDGRLCIEKALATLQAAELEHRRRHGFPLDLGESLGDREAHLVRISQLKKFFQSTLFLDVSPQPVNSRISETGAATAAGLAAVWMAFFQRNFDPGSAAVVSSGVFAYILKDRIKEWVKKVVARGASRIFADIDQRLLVEDRQIGITKEWLSFESARDLPGDVLALRERGRLSEVEGRLPEDVIHYRIFQDVRDSARAREGNAWALQETLRVNFDRYLKNMDDPYKNVAALDATGRLVTASCHRVYHFYIVIRPRYECGAASTRFRGRSGGRRLATIPTKDKIYRIVMDKNGVDRVETVS